MRTLIHCKMIQSLQKEDWQCLRNLNVYLPQDTAIPLLGIFSKGMKSHVHTKNCKLKFITALFTIFKNWKQYECLSQMSDKL